MTSPKARTLPRSREKDVAALNEIAKALTSTLQLPEIMRVVLARIKMLTFAEASSLLLYDPERHELVFAATETLRESTFGGGSAAGERGLAAWVARSGESAIVNDPSSDARCAGASGPLGPCEGRHLLAVPLKSHGTVIGVVEAADRYDGLPFDADDQEALESAVGRLADELAVTGTTMDSSTVRRVLADLAAVIPTQAVSLLLYDPEGRSLVFSGSRRLQSGVIDGLRMSADRGIAGWVARHRQGLRLDDASQDERYDSTIESETKFRPRSMLAVPVVIKDRLLGVIQVINRLDGASFDDDELQLVQILADYAAIAIENAALYRQARTASLTDDLTGLANTRHLNQHLPELLRQSPSVALLVLDFDNFKQVVDRYGHLVGSQTIAHIGKLIAKVLRPGDFAARFGGDEFVIVLPGAQAAEAVTLAEEVRRTIESCRHLDGRDVDISKVTASIGVALFPEHAADADGLLHAADAAMYAVKRNGKNGIVVAGDGTSILIEG